MRIPLRSTVEQLDIFRDAGATWSEGFIKQTDSVEHLATYRHIRTGERTNIRHLTRVLNEIDGSIPSMRAQKLFIISPFRRHQNRPLHHVVLRFVLKKLRSHLQLL